MLLYLSSLNICSGLTFAMESSQGNSRLYCNDIWALGLFNPTTNLAWFTALGVWRTMISPLQRMWAFSVNRQHIPLHPSSACIYLSSHLTNDGGPSIGVVTNLSLQRALDSRHGSLVAFARKAGSHSRTTWVPPHRRRGEVTWVECSRRASANRASRGWGAGGCSNTPPVRPVSWRCSPFPGRTWSPGKFRKNN